MNNKKRLEHQTLFLFSKTFLYYQFFQLDNQRRYHRELQVFQAYQASFRVDLVHSGSMLFLIDM